MREPFDIVVIGAGHAGVEAGLASARMGCATALVTHDARAIARMPCNPAIGGLGKGHLVREIDALGGQMGLVTDATGIQFRRLNTRKGAAVRGTRVQSDKQKYSEAMARVVRRQPNLTLISGNIVAIETHQYRIQGVRLSDQTSIRCRAVVLTTGTFLRGMMHVGNSHSIGGRFNEPASVDLAEALKALGLRLGRLKTGTPARLDRKTIDYDKLEPQPGHIPAPQMSYWSKWRDKKPPLHQVPCHITYTNTRTHEIVLENLDQSPIHSGAIESAGPRYCPSIEDKVVRFANRPRHQIFVEPEGLNTDSVYPNGISTSLPEHVQRAFISTISGFEKATIRRFGYAVEYDYCDPTQLNRYLQLREVQGFFLAGQLNGTTGYEEAAAQGLVGGINAGLYCKNEPLLLLPRNQAYTGVMIDDLVTRGIGGEPYRMFTSRAEYRLLLREDCAAARLTPIARKLGLIDDTRWRMFCERRDRTAQLRHFLEHENVRRDDDALQYELMKSNTSSARTSQTLADLLRRPQVTIQLLEDAGRLPKDLSASAIWAEAAEIEIKYAPYIERQRQQANRMVRMENIQLPPNIDYESIHGLSNEVREKLSRHQPTSLGQAGRIPGVTPAAIAILDVYLNDPRLDHCESSDPISCAQSS